jgi:creatinine amidohydrolase
VVKELRQSLKDVNIIACTDLRSLLGLLVQFSARHGVPASESGAHAGESETSMVLAIRKDLVDMERAEEGFVGRFEDKIDLVFSQGIKALTKIGVVGDPRKAEAKKGDEYLELWAENMVNYVRRQIARALAYSELEP